MGSLGHGVGAEHAQVLALLDGVLWLRCGRPTGYIYVAHTWPGAHILCTPLFIRHSDQATQPQTGGHHAATRTRDTGGVCVVSVHASLHSDVELELRGGCECRPSSGAALELPAYRFRCNGGLVAAAVHQRAWCMVSITRCVPEVLSVNPTALPVAPKASRWPWPTGVPEGPMCSRDGAACISRAPGCGWDAAAEGLLEEVAGPGRRKGPSAGLPGRSRSWRGRGTTLAMRSCCQIQTLTSTPCTW